MPVDPSEPSVKSRGKGVKKLPGLKRTKTGCASCRQKRHKCDETKPVCLRCSRAGEECLYPIEIAKDQLFQPYEQQQQIASTSYLPPQQQQPANAVASSSSTPFSSGLSSSNDLSLDSSIFYKSPTSLLEMYYPNSEERNLMYHFITLLPKLFTTTDLSSALTSTTSNSTSLSSSSSPSFPTPSSIPIDHLAPQLDIVAFITNRSNTTYHEAVSLSFLSIGAIHAAFLHHESAMSYLFDSDPSLAEGSLGCHARYTELAESLVGSSLALTRSSMMILGMKRRRAASAVGGGRGLVGFGFGFGGQQEDEEMELDDEEEEGLAMLTIAADACILTKCLAGGGDYHEALTLGKTLIGMRGGPLKMLEQAKLSGDRKKLRRCRVMIEEVVMWELFSCLSTGREPDLVFPNGLGANSSRLLANASTSDPLSSWYFSFAPSNTSRTAGTEDWDTVPTMLGMSRGLVEILHRVNVLYSRSRPPGWSSISPTIDYPLIIDPASLAQAHSLLVEINLWKQAVSAAKPVEDRNRLDMGNLIYTACLEMILQLDLLSYPPSHPEIQSRAKEIVRLVLLCFQRSGFVLGFMWPMIIAASCVSGEEDRFEAREALQTLRSVCCFDLNSAWAILDQVWARRDDGDVYASWRSVTGEGGGLVLV
ncbi:fungal-specific transcription factor domain-containing protein [Mrakia frigida]|uniref:Zn(II)2Cys6 transcription factor n=1 Tax=Mrakia frigida TaxID=29902 RepID=UPI003FCBFE76